MSNKVYRELTSYFCSIIDNFCPQTVEEAPNCEKCKDYRKWQKEHKFDEPDDVV